MLLLASAVVRTGSAILICLFAFLLFPPVAAVVGGDVAKTQDISPFQQHLPDCEDGFQRIAKKTTAKALICPMIRDEQGFLSEWTAYYQVGCTCTSSRAFFLQPKTSSLPDSLHCFSFP